MARFVTSTVATGQAVSTSEIWLKSAVVTAGSAAAVLTIKGAGSSELIISAPANSSFEWVAPGGPFQVGHIPGAVTLDLSGSGASARLDY